MRLILRVWLSVACCLALAAAPAAAALEMKKYPALQDFAREMQQQYGFSAAELQHAFDCASLRPEVIETMERPKELLPWYQYKPLFLTEENITRGVAFWNEHAEAIARAAQQYGVPPQIIVAILGVETRFGRHTGNYPVLDTLTTLTLEYPPRAAFFRGQLAQYLLLARELGADPCSIKGSYAGAIGLPQFLPSSYRRYAVDFDGDGKRDILNDADDAIGSVAHYLEANGWQAGAPVMEEVRLEGTLYFWIEKLGLKPALPLREFPRYGIYPRRLDDKARRAALISFEGDTGPFYRLGYDNFYVITRYNHNKRYALAVYELADSIRSRRQKGAP
jgi:membrane-bound lytic murein transglycosylase B